MEKPLVAIKCITYNHAPYIRRALDGFIMQKTNFPFVVIVHDDASTDGTTAIIQEYASKYPDIIKPIYEIENQYGKNFERFMELMHEAVLKTGSKYIAWCEGDDYWIDPLKLQKQVDFMEANPDYVMCYTDYDILNQDTGKIKKDLFESNPANLPEKYSDLEYWILNLGYACPPSWLYRKEYHPKSVLGSMDATFVYFAHFLHSGKIKYLPETTCVYRVLRESASHSTNFEKKYSRVKNLLQTQCKLVDLYGLNEEIKAKSREKFYNECLSLIIMSDDRTEIKNAYDTLNNKSLKQAILFGIYRCRLTSLLRFYKRHRK